MNSALSASLVSNIVDSFNRSIEGRNAAISATERALMEAVTCGQYLIEAKTSVGHGAWYRWFDENIRSNRQVLADFSIKTATNYMKLALASPVKLKDCHSKKDAYIALGMWQNDQPASNHINRDPDGTNWISILSGFTIKIEQLFDRRPLEEWQESDRQLFIERARPVVKRYVEAGGTL